MIPPFTRLRLRGWLPEPLHNYLYEQPVMHRVQPGYEISYSPGFLAQEEYPFGAIFVSSYYAGPTVTPRGWVSVPKITVSASWKPFGGSDDQQGVGPVDFYFHVDAVTWSGPPPFSSASSARTPRMYVSWSPMVNGEVVSVASGPGLTIRSHVISNAHPFATVENPNPPGIYEPHTHTLLFEITDLSANIDFDNGVEYFAPGFPVTSQPGDYLDHLEFQIADSSTVLFWYPQGHPLEPVPVVVVPRGWTSRPQVDVSASYVPAGGGSPVPGTVSVDFTVQARTWEGPPPYPTGQYALSGPLYLSWGTYVNGEQVEVTSGPEVTVQWYGTTNYDVQEPKYVMHTHTGVMDEHFNPYSAKRLAAGLYDRQLRVDFGWQRGEAYNFYDQESGGVEKFSYQGHYFDHVDVLVGGVLLASYYPRGHPDEPAFVAPPTDTHEHVVLVDWEGDIDIG